MEKTQILSNGSKWAGEEPDSIEKLLEVLKTHKLDIGMFAVYGFVRYPENTNLVKCHGNFLDISHVFDIVGDEESQEMKDLVNAIDQNIKRQIKKQHTQKSEDKMTQTKHTPRNIETNLITQNVLRYRVYEQRQDTQPDAEIQHIASFLQVRDAIKFMRKYFKDLNSFRMFVHDCVENEICEEIYRT